MTSEDFVYDAVIVGCGPVGAVMANLLGQAGLRVAVFESTAGVYHLPRAAHFDAEVMRVFQAIGLCEAVLPSTRPLKGMALVNGDGKQLFALNAAEASEHGWPGGFLFYQPHLEDALRAGLCRFPQVDVHYEHEVLAFEQHSEHVDVTVRDLSTGDERSVRSRYVLGADGGRSTTRKLAGIELEDLGFHQPWLVVDTMLKRPVDLPDMPMQIGDPARPSTFIPSAGDHRRWEFMLMPGDTPESMERPSRAAELIAPWVSPDDAEIIRAVVYTFHALIARQWRDGRVLILGDAAHQMPPFLGQGMCSGIRDAHNLEWKLRTVLAGAGDELLDTYEQERSPHVRTIIERAVNFGRIIQTTDPAVAAARDAHFLSQEAGSAGGMVGVGMPALSCGVLAYGQAAGEVFPQPLVQVARGGTRRLDDVLGDGFAVVGSVSEGPALARCAAVVSDGTGVGARAVAFGNVPAEDGRLTTVAESGTLLADWRTSHGATIVRPDRYVFGTASTESALDELAEELRRHLRSTRVPA